MKTHRKIPNLNITPKENLRPPLTILQLCLIAIIVVAGVMGYLAYQQRSDDLNTAANLEDQLVTYAITDEMNQTRTQATSLNSDIADLEEQLEKLQEALQEVQASQLDWETLFSTILSTTDPALEEVAQNGLVINISGTYSNRANLSTYQQKLRNLEMVTSANIPSIDETNLEFVLKLVLQGE